MSLHAFQQALLRLYTDQPSLKRLSENPDLFLKDYSLEAHERLAIINIPQAELAEFQHQLRTKRRKVAEKILRNPDTVVAVPFHEIGSPLLMWGVTPEIKTKPISAGMFLLLHTVAKQRDSFTLSALFRAYRNGSEKYSVSDLFVLAQHMYMHKLTTYRIKAL